MLSQFDASYFRNCLRFSVRFSDLDAMGHVNNARMLTYFEEGRAHWFRECIGMPAESTAYPVIVARVELDYLAPVPFGTEMGIYHRVLELGNKSLIMEGWACMENGEISNPVAKYLIVLVGFDYELEASIPISEEIRSKIKAYEISKVEL